MPTQFSPNEDRLKALVVEDEESFLNVLRITLESTNRFTVVSSQSGEDALKALRTNRFDVVILDITLPEMSGLNVLQWMNEQKTDTPVIMLTGTGSEHMAAEVMKLGAYDYIAKDDFEIARFPTIVSGVVERYLFRKDKHEEESRGRIKGSASIEILGESISSLADVANNSLARVTLISEECQHTMQPLLTPEAREQIENYHRSIKQELDVLIVITKSILDLSQSMYSRYKATQIPPTVENNITETAEPIEHKDSGNVAMPRL
jgi:FixJ family two-component response regulator